jgi:hypothetical protein
MFPQFFFYKRMLHCNSQDGLMITTENAIARCAGVNKKSKSIFQACLKKLIPTFLIGAAHHMAFSLGWVALRPASDNVPHAREKLLWKHRKIAFAI